MSFKNSDIPWRKAEANPEEHPDFHMDYEGPSQSIPEAIAGTYLKKMQEAKEAGVPNAFQKVWDEMPDDIKRALMNM